jgi:hypothetical protein
MPELPYWYRRRKRVTLPRDPIAEHAASLLRLCVFAERMITVTPSQELSMLVGYPWWQILAASALAGLGWQLGVLVFGAVTAVFRR